MAQSYTLHQIHFWYALAEQQEQDRLAMELSVLRCAHHGGEEDVKKMFNNLRG